MFKSQTTTLLLVSSCLVFTACSTNSEPAFYKPLNLKNKTESYKKGAGDGCKTAVESYRKNSDAFNNDLEYNKGWWAGRRNCEGREFIE